MDILTAIKIRNLDGTYSDPIPISALAENIIYDDKNTLIDALGTIETNEQGKVLSLQSQILEIKQNDGINATNAQQDQVPIADGQASWAWGNLDYTKLINKPQIEGRQLIGNKTFKDIFATKAVVSTQANGLMSVADKIKLNGIDTSADVNQYAYSNIKVGSTDNTATSESDTFTISAGNNITLTSTTKGVQINGQPGITNSERQKLATIAANAEANQNAFSNVKVGSTTLAADSKMDTLSITAGTGIALTPVASTDTLSIAVSGLTGNNVVYQDNVTITDIIDSIQETFAPLASPTFTGTPTAPTAAANTNNTQIATTAFVTTAIANSISGVQGIRYSVETTLPATGAVGTIYLISNSGNGQNIYDEYIWINNGYEKIGTTDVDLTGYVTSTALQTTLNDYVTSTALQTTLNDYLQTSDVVAITNAQIETILAT